MRFQLTIESKSDALVNDHPDELAAILRRLSEKIRAGSMPSGVCDSNGNSIGTVTFREAGRVCTTCGPVDDPDCFGECVCECHDDD